MSEHVSVYEATHVVPLQGPKERIVSTWGIVGRHLAPPSEGGFGVVTESGRRITMWEARYYTREDE